MAKRRVCEFWNISAVLILSLFLFFLVYPIAGLLKEAVILKDGRFSLDAFHRFFSKPYYYSTIANSFRIAVSVMAFSLLLGIPFSYF